MRTEDGSIIHECLNGKPEAFGVLVDKYKTGIYAFVYAQLRNFEDAQDVTQEAFIQAYQDLRSLRRWESFAFWLYRIASTRCKKWLRARSRRPDSEFIEDQDPIVLDELSLDAYRDSQIDESLREALDSLPEAYREVLLLHYFGGMTSKDIARAVGTSPAAILQRLTRARAQLKEEIVGMMSKTFKQRRLPVTFTFRIVEAVKRLRIQPMPRMSGLPWGLSLAAGVIIAVLGLNPDASRLIGAAIPDGSPPPAETQVLKSGEIPVDVLKITNMTAVSSRQGNGEGGELNPPNLQNTLFTALQGGDTWTRRADMPTERSDLGIGVVSGRIYAIGGSNWEGVKTQRLTIVEEYDPATDTWTKKTDMPTARCTLGIGVVNEKIYVIGGIDNDGDLLSTVEEYDPKADRWSRRTDMPTTRASFGTCVANGKIYTIGGGTWESPYLNFSTVEEYDPVTDKWTEKADMPTPRLDLSACSVNGKIYAMGGMTHHVDLGNAIVEEYDPATDKWTRRADMPAIMGVVRRCFGCVSVNGRIYAIGGALTLEPWSRVSTVDEYDPTTNRWTRKTDMPTPRQYLGVGAVNGKIYAIGGTTGSGYVPLVEEYDTGFSGKNVDLKGKLPTKWGEVRTVPPSLGAK